MCPQCTQQRWLGVAGHADRYQLQLGLRATGYWLVHMTDLQEVALLCEEAVDGEYGNPDEDGKGHEITEGAAPRRVDVVAVRQQRMIDKYEYQQKLLAEHASQRTSANIIQHCKNYPYVHG